MSSTYANPTYTAAAETIAEGARRRVSWSALFAGAIITIAIEILLDVLGTGVGLDVISPGNGGAPDLSSYATGAGIWWMVSTIIALLFGSYAAARLAGVITRFDGVLHGLVIWGMAVLFTIWVLGSAIGGLVGGAFSLLGGTVSAAGHALSASIPQATGAAGITKDTVQTEAQTLLAPPASTDPATMTPQDAQKEIARLLPDLASSGQKADAAKQRIITIMAAQLKLTPAEATQRFDETRARLEQMGHNAAETATSAIDKGTTTASQASFVAFGALLIGAIAAAIGGAIASPRRVTFYR